MLNKRWVAIHLTTHLQAAGDEQKYTRPVSGALETHNLRAAFAFKHIKCFSQHLMQQKSVSKLKEKSNSTYKNTR